MNVLKQFNLNQRPALRVASSRADTVKEGLVINFVRKLPSSVFKKPRRVSGYATMRREREEEFAPELPVEGEEKEEGGGGAAGSATAAATTTTFARNIEPRETIIRLFLTFS
jgi:hypothetical protein